ncbi:M48 family metallopeptidase [Neisseria animalis]|uniref:Peptidase M48 domain-containing protein n=1 Tax=Neisseria animalis TaxID=492 RepID=A0A5P3MNL9_NEIAN|nr:M48 family metallopeptidase [Neisseria animalis]QEY23137.1 hypothetical protein D0T90_00290 [Neisseria animalis]ROW32468.1 hypothetical protein CGZ60_04990 [Neisseria animalis]VEE08219.1 Uncharacterized metalloprotease yggG [Neisseria animalis]
MADSIEVRYYDGRQNIPHRAVLHRNGGMLEVRYEGGTRCYRWEEADYVAAVGNVLPALELPDEARIEFLSTDVPAWLPLKNKAMLHQVGRFEKSWKWVLVGLVTVIAVAFSVFQWGIPTAAYYVARQLPEQTLAGIGGQAEELVVRMTGESRLDKARQQAVSDLYYQTLKPENPAKLLFRQGNVIGANALAIPNNTIVLTDELVNLARDDWEILAVLAHEQGHLYHRHSIQQGLRGIGLGVFLLAVSGEAGDLLSNVPVLLVSARYSQSFELEADRYAARELKRLSVDTAHLSALLQRLEASHGQEQNGAAQILSTHPLTKDRVEQIEKLSR